MRTPPLTLTLCGDPRTGLTPGEGTPAPYSLGEGTLTPDLLSTETPTPEVNPVWRRPPRTHTWSGNPRPGVFRFQTFSTLTPLPQGSSLLRILNNYLRQIPPLTPDPLSTVTSPLRPGRSVVYLAFASDPHPGPSLHDNQFLVPTHSNFDSHSVSDRYFSKEPPSRTSPNGGFLSLSGDFPTGPPSRTSTLRLRSPPQTPTFGTYSGPHHRV